MTHQILLVEDDLLQQKIMKALFIGENIALDTANNASEAQTSIRRTVYKYILMDLGLPDKNGIDVTKEIRQGDSVNKNTPIIALTAQIATEEQIANLLRDGFNQFIPKPLESAHIEQLASKWLT